VTSIIESNSKNPPSPDPPTPAGLERLVTFFGTEDFGAALIANDFDVRDIVNKLTNVIRNGKPADSISAIKALDKLMRDRLELAGVIGTASVHQNLPGTNGVVQVSVTEKRLVQNLSENSLNAIPQSQVARVLLPDRKEGDPTQYGDPDPS